MFNNTRKSINKWSQMDYEEYVKMNLLGPITFALMHSLQISSTEIKDPNTGDCIRITITHHAAPTPAP